MANHKITIAIKDEHNLVGSSKNYRPDPSELIHLALSEHYEYKYAIEFEAITNTEYENDWE